MSFELNTRPTEAFKWSASTWGRATRAAPGRLLWLSRAPVGIYDSGVGGLSVLREIRAAMPAESIEYVADSANAPWGDKPPGFVRDRGLRLARFLVAQGVKAIVIGSNTGTAGSAEAVRAALSIPVVGIEPGIKPAVAATRSGVIGRPLEIPQRND